MGRGIFLMVVGAILALAVRQGESPAVDLDTVGFILVAAGVAVVLLGNNGNTKERVVTRIEDHSDPYRPTHTLIERINDGDTDPLARDVVDDPPR